MNENANSETPPVVTLQRVETVSMAPIQPGALATGANLQIGSVRDAATIATTDLRVRIDAALRKNVAVVKKLQGDLADAEKAYKAVVDKLPTPSGLESDVDAVIVALRRFYPQAARAVESVPDAQGNRTGAVRSKRHVEVNEHKRTYEVTLYARNAGEAGERETHFSRTFALPADALAALDKIDSIQASIGVAASRSNELRAERTRIHEHGEQFVANLMRMQLGDLPNGVACVANLDATRRDILRNLGLLEEDGDKS